MIKCSWKSQFGVDCFTCGFQRAIQLLLEGKFQESFLQFPAALPLIISFMILGLHLRFKFQKGAFWIIFFFSLSAALMLINFSTKNLYPLP